eukprot:TRINITY_DN4773_c0_g1_i1.p1 TRINITY_DN4773_c0_g1~~TRINITY_DN4773_c0_g1_i1.p1  ORF type:complete len:261 (-),score=49.00 TRINITY_DN4773_c0_g1_i1:112-894(-)
MPWKNRLSDGFKKNFLGVTTMADDSSKSKRRIQQDLRNIMDEPVEGIFVELVDDNLYEWRVYIEGPKSTPFEGGIFETRLSFPTDYPFNPPTFKFHSKIWHPNVYPDGKVCISILHTPGEDPLNPGETPEMRWLPVHTVSTILQCFLSIIDNPGGAPANVDAQVDFNKNKQVYITKNKQLSEESKKYLPSHVKIPHPDTDPNDPTYQRRVRKLRDEFNTEAEPFSGGFDDDMMGDDDYGDDIDYDDYDGIDGDDIIEDDD